MHLSGIDTNLLVALDALLRERNVTRAAKSVRMGQPGMSHALARLRAHFGDPLLVRSGRSMVLTPRAKDLVAPVREVVERMERIFTTPKPFDPGTSKREFRLATTDHVGFLLLPHLIPRVAREGPSVDLLIRPVTEQPVAEQLASGEIDAAISVFPELPSGLRKEHLFAERFCCAVRADHPAVGSRLTLKQYAELSHIFIAPRGTKGGSTVNDALAEHGLSRRVALTVPHFLLAPLVVAGSDHIVTLSERLARRFAPLAKLRLLRPPLELPSYAISLVWHDKDHTDEGHRWLRKLIVQAGADLQAEGDEPPAQKHRARPER